MGGHGAATLEGARPWSLSLYLARELAWHDPIPV